MKAALQRIEGSDVDSTAAARSEGARKLAPVLSLQKALVKEILSALPSINPEALTITHLRPRKRPSTAVLESRWNTGIQDWSVSGGQEQLKETWRSIKDSLTKLMPSPEDMRRWVRKTEVLHSRVPFIMRTAADTGAGGFSFDAIECNFGSASDIMEQVGLTAPSAPRELRYGICKKNETALFARCDNRSVRLEGLFAGQLYRVLSVKEGWVQISLDSARPGYTRKGWIEALAHCQLTSGEFKLLKSGDSEMVKNYLKAMRISA